MSRRFLWGECVALFLLAPIALIFTEDIIPVIPTILLITAIAVFVLRRSGWQWRDALELGHLRSWRNMLLVFGVFATVWSVIAWQLYPEQFLSFPRERPDIWILVMLLYPLLSALPQEFIYRTFLFHRYRTLSDHSLLRFVLFSGVAFMWAHILFMNWFALFATLMGGLVFAWRYWHTRSLILVSVEHALYGNLFFTLGLGSQFLYSGMV